MRWAGRLDDDGRVSSTSRIGIIILDREHWGRTSDREDMAGTIEISGSVNVSQVTGTSVVLFNRHRTKFDVLVEQPAVLRPNAAVPRVRPAVPFRTRLKVAPGPTRTTTVSLKNKIHQEEECQDHQKNHYRR